MINDLKNTQMNDKEEFAYLAGQLIKYMTRKVVNVNNKGYNNDLTIRQALNSVKLKNLQTHVLKLYKNNILIIDNSDIQRKLLKFVVFECGEDHFKPYERYTIMGLLD